MAGGEPAAPICVRCALGFALSQFDQSLSSAPTVDHADSSAPPSSPSLIGSAARGRIGPYLLHRVLGEGGMGIVWEAEQQEPVRRRVALKCIRGGLDGGQFQARFESERQALALMSHPNIARAFDAGCTRDGQPYYAMEMVDGPWITRFCDEQRLDVRQRLELFIEVCRGIQHAHQRGVIHRDIKPSNILIQVQEGRPVPKVIDFGVAKAMGALLTDRTLVTGVGQMVGTPEYMSPEQAGPAGFDVDTRTDVYSLGALLHELLTGELPFGTADGDADSLRRRIREDDPVRPSARVAGAARSSKSDAGAASKGEAATIAAMRRITPTALARALRGDLDWIVLKALAKDRARRYATPDDLAADIVRYLAHEPVLAGPPSTFYRTWKFVRRHRFGVTAAALAAAGGVAFVAVMAVYTARVTRERDRANAERRTAEARFLQLRSLSVSVFDLDLAIRNLPKASEARRVLVAAALGYLEGLASEVHGDLDLAQEIADGYYRLAEIQGVPIDLNLGDFAAADESLKKADHFVEMVLHSRPLDRRALERSAMICHSRMILAQSQRRNPEARSHALKAVERVELLLEQGNPSQKEYDAAGTVFGNAALAFMNMHAYEEGARLARRSVDLARQRPDHQRNIGLSLSVLANALRAQGDLEGALGAIREAGQRIEAGGVTDETVRMTDKYLLRLREGLILGEDGGVSLGRPAEAIVAFREALEITDEGARRDPSDFTSRGRLATAGREMGDILRWREPREALTAYDLAYRRLGETKGNLKTRRDQARLLASSSYALRRLQRGAEAQKRIEAALNILKETKDYPAERINHDSEVYTVLVAAADHHAENGRAAEAIGIYANLLEKVKDSERDPQTDLIYANGLSLLYKSLAELYRRTGAADEAEGLEATRTALWQHWNGRLPGNDFVLRQLQPDSSP